MSERDDGDDASASIRRALDEQTEQVFALVDRTSYLELVETQLRTDLTEVHQVLSSRDIEIENLRHLVQQQQEQLAALCNEREVLSGALARARKILRDIRESRAYRTLRRVGRWNSVERDMRRFFGT